MKKDWVISNTASSALRFACPVFGVVVLPNKMTYISIGKDLPARGKSLPGAGKQCPIY